MIIKLQLGITIKEPEKSMLHYYNKAGKGSQAYDKARLPENNLFTEAEINQCVKLINGLGARMPYKAVGALIKRKSKIDFNLSQVPASLTILNSHEEIPWKKIEVLFNTCRVPYVSISRMTKILHKKRPQLIPILDKNILVSKYLEPILRKQGIRGTKEIERAIYYIKEVKKDIDTNRETLIKLQQTLNTKGFDNYDTSFVRLIDIIIWGYFSYKEQT